MIFVLQFASAVSLCELAICVVNEGSPTSPDDFDVQWFQPLCRFRSRLLWEKNSHIELFEFHPHLKSGIDEEMAKVKEALIDYARREGVTVIKGSNRKVRVKFDEKLKFPGKNEPDREELDNTITQAGKWLKVSQLDRTALTQIVEGGLWDKELIDKILKYGWIEETSVVYLSKLRQEE